MPVKGISLAYLAQTIKFLRIDQHQLVKIIALSAKSRKTFYSRTAEIYICSFNNWPNFRHSVSIITYGEQPYREYRDDLISFPALQIPYLIGK